MAASCRASRAVACRCTWLRWAIAMMLATTDAISNRLSAPIANLANRQLRLCWLTSSPSSSSRGIPRIVAARSATFSANRGSAGPDEPGASNQLRSVHRGSSRKAPRRGAGTQSVAAEKSLRCRSQANVPSSCTNRIVEASLCRSHHWISAATYSEPAAAWLSSTTSQRACCRPCSMDDHSAGFADMDESSRKMRTARSRYHGLAKVWMAVCSRCASRVEAERAYEMNASHCAMLTSRISATT